MRKSNLTPVSCAVSPHSGARFRCDSLGRNGQTARMDKTAANASRPVLTLGNPVLEAPCTAVSFPDPGLADELQAMHATLAEFRARSGYGRAIAAPQVGIPKRIVAMHLGATPFALINPEITWRSSEMQEVWDDCLSVPDRSSAYCGIAASVSPTTTSVGSESNGGTCPPDMAELVQHEIDHLDGVLMTTRASDVDPIRPIAEHASLVAQARPRHRLSLARIARAARDIPPEFANSPQFEYEPLSEALGCRLTLKLEFANPIRSFKARGAAFVVSEMLRRGEREGVVCASAGNWGQAMAYVCSLHGLPIVVYAAHNANPLKIARMRALGAEVRLHGTDFDEAKAAAKAFAARAGMRMVEDGQEPEISEGHATIAIELLARNRHFDSLVVPLGNGALLNGIGRWTKAASPATRVIGVCAAAAPSMARSWRGGRVVETTAAETMADGIAVRVPIADAVDDMHGIVDDVLLVDEEDIARAMVLAHDCAGIVLEPAGAVGIAAIRAYPAHFAGQQVATVLSGNNIEPAGGTRLPTPLSPSRYRPLSPPAVAAAGAMAP
ncbi:pyridoxal-phosphate dependent enzyme [Luteimonas saliphila]|uniref:pyridoxal-phosphate dependent enzyme n=1 Tax=Luteimonas saliphila TaxID=2804919 RepID=UPI00192D71D5|nr:pyridoxal-phosphate dependent enzyme [Luteimonas saliphila]